MSKIKKRITKGEWKGHYTKEYLDLSAKLMIEEGKDIDFYTGGKKYTIDIKKYEALLRFERPELFKNEKDTNI